MDASELKRIVGGNIRNERSRQNLTQSALADMVGISLKQIAAIESGNAYPRPETMAAICQALNTNPSTFFHNEMENDDESRRFDHHLAHLKERFEAIVAEESEDYKGRK